jgi:hypothetical protein
MDNINAPDYAFGLILAWARGANAEEYSFTHRERGLDCARNVTVLVKSIANATQLLPSVLSVSCHTVHRVMWLCLTLFPNCHVYYKIQA